MSKPPRLVGGCWRIVFLASSWILAGTLCADAAPWAPAGLPGGRVVALADDPFNPGGILAAAARAGIYKTVNGGATWSLSRTGLTDLDVLSLLADQNLPNTFYAGGAAGKIFKSVDGGASWFSTPAEPGAPVNVLVMDPRPGPTIFAGTSAGILRTTDRGATWVVRNEGLVDVHVQALAIDFSLPQTTLYAGTPAGVFKSADGADLWLPARDGIEQTSVHAIAIDPFAAGKVYAGTPAGVYKSVNGGSTWTLAGFGLTTPDVRAMAADPQDGLTLFAGTFGGGLFRTVNGGASWAQANTGLAN